jgi:hypothetical protein
VHLPREELDDRVQQLNRFRSTLVEQMRSAATQLLLPGIAPEDELDTALDDYRLQLKCLQFDLELDSNVEGSAWDPIEARLDFVRRGAAACERLALIDRLRISSGDQSLLNPVLTAADEVRRCLQTPWRDHSLLEDVEDHRHILCRLIRLLEAPELLTDEDWTRDMTVIQEQFGVPVSTAIARGRVQLVASDFQE